MLLIGSVLVIVSIFLSPQFNFSFKKIPGFIFLILCAGILLCLYSLYLGSFNESNSVSVLSIDERYLRLPIGLFNLLTQKLGWALLLFMLLLNFYLIRKVQDNVQKKEIITFTKWIALFSLIYVLMLPLGGFRNYRLNIIRYDTILPVTVCAFLIYSMSTVFIIQQLSNKTKRYYIAVLILISLIFTVADLKFTDMNNCERKAIMQIANSHEKITLVTNDCTIISWNKINDWKQSEMNSKLLQLWNVTKDPKFYYQK